MVVVEYAAIVAFAYGLSWLTSLDAWNFIAAIALLIAVDARQATRKGD
jgi:hypothetical protein